MSSSEVNYHIDRENQQVIAERDGVVVGLLPWAQDGKNITFARNDLPVLVAPHERRKGIGTAMTNLLREQFPREEGYIVSSTAAISPIMRDVLFGPTMDERRNAWFDNIGEETASPVTNPDATRYLNLAQQDLDRLLGK